MWTLEILFFLLLDTVCGQSIVSSVHCHNRKEISPCTCRYREPVSLKSTRAIMVECKDVESFSKVVDALKNQFERNIEISLSISHSKLDDLPELSFAQLNLSIHKLSLNLDHLSEFPETVFSGLSQMEYLSLADNELHAIPHHILDLMPMLKTVDFKGGQISSILSMDLQRLDQLNTLILSENNIYTIEEKSLPSTLVRLQLARNRITTMNNTMRGMYDLQWLFLNENLLKSLDNQLPDVAPNNSKLMLISLEHNYLSHPPPELKKCAALNKLRLDANRMTTLDGALSHLANLEHLNLTHNNISMLAKDEFAESNKLTDLLMSHNSIVHLNGSLTPLTSLRNLYLSHNKMEEFNLKDILGLIHLDYVDLSHNIISQLTGRTENMVELEFRIIEFRLEFNKLKSLSGSLMGLHNLKKLNLSHNCIERISPDDFIGLDSLKVLDISHNQLTTLEETSKTVLPSLDSLFASHNWVRILEKDFHGLPRLCWADLTYNRIEKISEELIQYTQCQLYGVNSVLRIYLKGNSVLCDSQQLDKLLTMEANNNTKFYGNSECHNTLAEKTSQHKFFKKQR